MHTATRRGVDATILGGSTEDETATLDRDEQRGHTEVVRPTELEKTQLTTNKALSQSRQEWRR